MSALKATLACDGPVFAAIQAIQAERDQLRAEVERLKAQRDNLLKPMREQAIARAERAEAEVERLRAGIGECLRTNAHLADGEDCTLIGLKRCLRDPTAAPRQSALDATPRHSE